MKEKRKCSKCKKEKLIKNFHKYYGKYQSWCRLCQNKHYAKIRQYKRNNPLW